MVFNYNFFLCPISQDGPSATEGEGAVQKESSVHSSCREETGAIRLSQEKEVQSRQGRIVRVQARRWWVRQAALKTDYHVFDWFCCCEISVQHVLQCFVMKRRLVVLFSFNRDASVNIYLTNTVSLSMDEAKPFSKVTQISRECNCMSPSYSQILPCVISFW